MNDDILGSQNFLIVGENPNKRSNKFKFLIIVSLILSSCNSCKLPGNDDYLWRIINNNSNGKIVFESDYRIKGDTSIAKYPFDYDTFRGIYTYGLIREYDKNRINSRWRVPLTESSNKVYMVFIFSYDSLTKLPWSKVRDNYLILKRYDLTLKELDSMNWTINYP